MPLNIPIFSSYKEIYYSDKILAYREPCQTSMMKLSIETPNIFTAQKMKFSNKDFYSFLWIWLHLLKKSLMENFIFCAVSLKKIHHRYLTVS